VFGDLTPSVLWFSQAAVQRFEVAAGRSAMVGVVVAMGTELVLPLDGLFGAVQLEQVAEFMALAMAMVAGSALLAAASKRTPTSLKVESFVSC
jgi:hypothetical protein